MADQGIKRKVGRPMGGKNAYKLTDLSKERIIHAIILGEPLEIAARYGHVDFSTMARWMKDGERFALAQGKGKTLTEGEQKYVDFYYEIEDAKMESEIRAAHAIDVGFTGIKTHVVERKYDKDGNITSEKEYDKYILEPDFRAAVEKLARRHPERWAKKDQLEHTGSKDSPIMIQTMADWAKLAAKELEEYEAKGGVIEE
jgi:hypothetical protein